VLTAAAKDLDTGGESGNPMEYFVSKYKARSRWKASSRS